MKPKEDMSRSSAIDASISTDHYAQVAVDVPMFGALTYKIPAHLEDVIRPGQLVQVPFRNKAKTGLVMSIEDKLADPSLAGKIRDLLESAVDYNETAA